MFRPIKTGLLRTQRKAVFPAIVLLLTLTGCSQPSSDYFPLQEGLYWQYGVRQTNPDGESSFKHIVENTGASEGVFLRRYYNGAETRYRRDANGVFQLGSEGNKRASEGQKILPADYQEGDSWQGISKAWFLQNQLAEINAGQASLSKADFSEDIPVTHRIASVSDSVTVPAGKFTDCLQVVTEGEKTMATGTEVGDVEIRVLATDWYAPGVGLVKSVRKERTNLVWGREFEQEWTLDLFRKP